MNGTSLNVPKKDIDNKIIRRDINLIILLFENFLFILLFINNKSINNTIKIKKIPLRI